jgi:hypothetical protein
MKISKTQQELYDAMKNGVKVSYMPYMGRFRPNAYYFRYDNNKRVTAAAEALLKRGLAEKYDKDWRGHMLRAKAEPQPEAAQPEKGAL